jgi:hypothetical protein
MSVTSQAAPPVDTRPTNRRPPLQRPTPSRCIRLHLDTHRELGAWKRPGESFDALVGRFLTALRMREDLRQMMEKVL